MHTNQKQALAAGLVGRQLRVKIGNQPVWATIVRDMDRRHEGKGRKLLVACTHHTSWVSASSRRIRELGGMSHG